MSYPVCCHHIFYCFIILYRIGSIFVGFIIDEKVIIIDGVFFALYLHFSKSALKS